MASLQRDGDVSGVVVRWVWEKVGMRGKRGRTGQFGNVVGLLVQALLGRQLLLRAVVVAATSATRGRRDVFCSGCRQHRDGRARVIRSTPGRIATAAAAEV